MLQYPCNNVTHGYNMWIRAGYTPIRSLMNINSDGNPQPFVTPASIKGEKHVTMMPLNYSKATPSAWNLSQGRLEGFPVTNSMFLIIPHRSKNFSK